ncbi:MAG: saccharopine dehydrogenase NADP-binding domain-containing protein [Alphaproteobacteria bacterium]
MTKVLLVGAGKIGSAILDLLGETGDYTVTVIDRSEPALSRLQSRARAVKAVDVSDESAVRAAMAGHDAVLSAAPFHLTQTVARAARAEGLHYFDLTEDRESAHAIRDIAQGAETTFAPQCGLAPGFISIVANDMARGFTSLRNIYMRVGALPQFPSNSLKYNLTWSTDGLINEYCNPCEAIYGGQRIEVLPLEGIETFALDGDNYEAFNTSGGLGTLCDTYAGKVEDLNYKTVRYPGHRDMMRMLVRDLRLDLRRDLLREILEEAVPMTLQDVVLVFVTVSGEKDGRLMQETYAKKIYSTDRGAGTLSAIQLTTASGITAVLDMVVTGALPDRGFLRQEDVPLAGFLANRFGLHYA